MRYFTFIVIFWVINLITARAQQQTVGIFLNDSLSYNGYTLFAPVNYVGVYLIDNCGYQVNNWFCGPHDNFMAYLQEDGSLIRTGDVFSYEFQAGGRCGVVDCYSWEGDLLWEFEYHGEDHYQHHDIAPMPNGHFLMIAWQKYSVQEATAQGKNPLMLQNELWMDQVLEVDPTSGDIVWGWHAWDHLIQDFDPFKENFGVVADSPEKIDINYSDFPGPGYMVDWMHTNSIDYDEEFDQILLTVRNYSEIWVIDHSTTTAEAAGSSGGMYGRGGDLLYRWGNPEAYGRGTEDDQVLRHMHDASWIPGDYPEGGKITVFNNNQNYQQSAVIVFDPPVDLQGFYADPGDEAFDPPTYDWIYDGEELFSSSLSGAQLMPNGNMLICEGQGGIFTEFTYDEKELVWRYRSPVNLWGPIYQGSAPQDISQFKIRRYSPDFPGFNGKELIPGDPVEQDPWVYDCTIYWDTTITHVNEKKEFVCISAVNPFRDEVIVHVDDFMGASLQVLNLQGILLTEEELHSSQVRIAASGWPPGIYILRITTFNQNRHSLKLVRVN